MNWPSDEDLSALLVLPDGYRGERLRRSEIPALVAAIAHGLAGAGHRAMVLWVLRDNAPSRRFYESLGARPVEGWTRYRWLA